jgi:Abnormal spindle-like microcephaly-assoc'd, ASPM-SPD-2-Hydin
MRRMRVAAILVSTSAFLSLAANSAMAQGGQITPLIAFGTVNAGSSSTIGMTLTNNGSTNTTISQVSVSNAAFTATGVTTPYTLAAGGTVTLSITFAPQTATSYSGTVSVTSDSTNSPLNIALSGTGTQPPEAQLSANPASENFGNTDVGSTATQTITLTNNGNTSATINQVSATGTGFSVSGLSTPYTLAAGGTTSLKVSFSPTSAGNYSGTASIVSSAANSPTTIALSGTGATSTSGSALLCGQSNDKAVHLPPNYDTFTPPPAGQSYVDPVFGCSVKRLTSSGTDENAWDGTHLSFANYYSTLTAMNASDSLLFIVSNDGGWRVRDTDGKVVISESAMPPFEGHPVWDASNGNVFYYTHNNSLYSGTINGSSVTSKVLHSFSEYSGVVSSDSADLSQDGDHIALVGQNSNNTMDAFVWSLSQQTKTSKYTTTCTNSGSVANGVGCLHKIQLTPNNLLSIQFNNDGTGKEQGIRLWNGSSLVHLEDNTNHYDTGYDLNGVPMIAARGNSLTLSGETNPCPSGWGMDVRQLNNLSSSICLLDNVPSWHISYRGSASQPWIGISFFDDRTPGPEFFSNDGNYRSPSSSNWQLYEDEIVVAKVDAGAVYRLAHARSRSMESYWAQPHATMSRDGKYVVFTSNMANPHGCPANMHVANECSDVYLIRIQ